MKGVKENCGQERQFFILSVYSFSYFPVIPSFSLSYRPPSQMQQYSDIFICSTFLKCGADKSDLQSTLP